MAGYVIHISIGKEYLRKHTIQGSHDDFIQGVIAPDGVKDKSLTHYGASSSKPELARFLQEHSLSSSYDYGYFLHLVTDYLFYNHYLDIFSKSIYQEYDLLNANLIKKYDLILPESLQDKVFFKEDGNLTILNYDLVCRFIDEVSSLDLDQLKNEIQEGSLKWHQFKDLKKI